MTFTAVTAAAQQATLPPASEVIARYIKVSRADLIVNGRSSVRTRGKSEVPAQNLVMTINEVRAKPNHLVAVVNRPGRGELRSGFDGEHAWAIDPATGPRLYSGDELNDRRFTASFTVPLRDASAYPVRETVEIAEFGGQKCYRIRLVSTTGKESFECFSVESGLLVAAQKKTNTPMGLTDNLLLYAEWKEFGGAMFASRVVSEVMGIKQILTLESVTFDDAKPEEFELPAAVRALVK